MKKLVEFRFEVDVPNQKMHVVRQFRASRSLVWKAWTDPSILCHWWAPKPWTCETKSMELKAGGRWHYCMVGPEGERHWCLAEFTGVQPESRLQSFDYFCDESGNIHQGKPRTDWDIRFLENEDETIVDIDVLFKDIDDMNRILEMGFREGFTMGLDNLEQYLASQV